MNHHCDKQKEGCYAKPSAVLAHHETGPTKDLAVSDGSADMGPDCRVVENGGEAFAVLWPDVEDV